MDPSIISDLNAAIASLSSQLMLLTALLFAMTVSVIVGLIVSISRNRGPKADSDLLDADLHIDRGNYIYLAGVCRDVLERKPNNTEAHWYLALCHYHQNEFREATNHFELVNKTNPHWVSNTSAYMEMISELSDQTEDVTH